VGGAIQFAFEENDQGWATGLRYRAAPLMCPLRARQGLNQDG
jgi:hypothetical protein